MRKHLGKIVAVLFSTLIAFGVTFGPKVLKAGVACSVPFNLQNNTVADATQVMANYNAILTCLGNAAAAGANSDITSLLGLLTPIPASGGGTNVFIGGTSTGTANAQVVNTLVPTGFALVNGNRGVFTAGFTNTASPTTLNLNSTGAKHVVHPIPFAPGYEDLTGGEIQAGAMVEALYNQSGDVYELLNVTNQQGDVGAQTSILSAGTTDLSVARNHNAFITGTNTITSFGSNASINFPEYRITFAASLTLTQNASSMILPGAANITTQTNDTAVAIYLGSGNWQVVEYSPAAGTPVVQAPIAGFLFNCILSGGGSQTLTIQACLATSDDQLVTMKQGSTYTKTFSNFVVGSGNGALDTGTIANNTWYSVFEIQRPDTGVVDYLFSLSPTAPTMPANYTKKRRLGSIRTDATPNILSFQQKGDEFWWTTPPALDVNGTSLSTANRTLITVTVPASVQVKWIGNAAVAASAGSGGFAYFTDPAVTDSAVASQTSPLAQVGILNGGTGTSNAYGSVSVWTNNNQQVGTRGNLANSYWVQTLGWLDPRGRDH